MKANTLVRKMRRLASKRGWALREAAGKGSHRKIWLNGRFTVIPMHAGDMPRGTLRAILRDLDVTEEDLEG
jgi:predicted RNA binding protein YcfA (HicA-like mRNA interferase family)